MLPSQSNRRTPDGEGDNNYPADVKTPPACSGMRTRGAARRAAAGSGGGNNGSTKQCPHGADPACTSSRDCNPAAPSPAAPPPVHHQPQHECTQSSCPADEDTARYEVELAQRRAAHGPLHPSVAETLNALGLVHQHMRSDPQSALRCHAEALRILRRAVAEEAVAEEANGDENLTMADLQRGITTANQSNLRFDLAVTMSDMGDAYWKIGCNGDASAAYGSALESFADAGMGKDHPRVQSTRRRLARLRRC